MKHSTTIIKKIGIAAFWILIWQIVYLYVNQEILVVSPVSVILDLYKKALDPSFWQIIVISVCRILEGFALSVVIGSLLALICNKVNLIYEFINPIFSLIKAVPVASFIILAIVWLKSPQIPVLISFMMVVPIVFTNVYEGLVNIDVRLIEMGQIFKLSKKDKIKYITFPSVAPYLLASIKNGIGLAWKSGIAAEIISAPKYSIGRKIYDSKTYIDTLGLFSWTFVVIILSFLFEFAIIRLLDKITKKYNRFDTGDKNVEN